MINLEIKHLESSDVDAGSWQPGSRDEVFFHIHMEIGEVESDAVNVFRATVVTPEGLRRHGTGDVFSERATLVFREYSPELLAATLERIVEACRGYSWDDSVRSLNQYFRWEYEDFR